MHGICTRFRLFFDFTDFTLLIIIKFVSDRLVMPYNLYANNFAVIKLQNIHMYVCRQEIGQIIVIIISCMQRRIIVNK